MKKIAHVPSDIFPAGVFELQVLFTRKKDKRVKLKKSSEVADFVRDVIFNEGMIEYAEYFFILLLDRSSNCFAFKRISCGGISGTFVDPKLIFQTALLCHSTQIILCHNHPSGSTTPSTADIQLTKKIVQGGDLLEIAVLDHLIISEDGYFSFADEALI
jgi:DNA repair protein RadC